MDIWDDEREGGDIYLINSGEMQFVDRATFAISEIAETEGKFIGHCGVVMFRSVNAETEGEVSLTVALTGKSLMELLAAIGGNMGQLIETGMVPPLPPGYPHGT